jgi:hypothetical protein
VSNGVDTRRNGRRGFLRGFGKGPVDPDRHRVERRKHIQGMQDARCRIQDASPVCAFSIGRARSLVLGVRSPASDRLRCRVPGVRYPTPGTRYLVRGARNGTEFAGGCRTFRRSRRRVRASGLLRRRVAVRRGTRVGVGGRRVSAGGGLGFAAVAAGEGPRAKKGRLYGRRSPRTIRRGLGHRLWPLKTLNENPGEIRRDGTSSSVHRKRVPTHRPDFPLIRRPRIRKREGCPPEEGPISQPIGPQEAQRDQDLRPPQRE